MIPLCAGEGEPWVDGLIAGWPVDGPAARSLREQLVRLQTSLASRLGTRCSALVWVPAPGSGHWAATVVTMTRQSGGANFSDPDGFMKAFAHGGFVDPGDNVLQQRLWAGEFHAGRFGAAHRMTESPAREEDLVMETVDYAVFPPGLSQFASLIFHAQSAGSFDDMPARTQAIAETVEFTIGSKQ
jgi:hypothetical protein